MRALLAAIRIGLLDMRGDLRRFGLLVACLAVGTALIAGVGSVGASITEAVERDAAVLMGGDVELSRADRAATPEELAVLEGFGRIARVIDTNVRAEAEDGTAEAFVDLMAIGSFYPLFGSVSSPSVVAGTPVHDLLSAVDGVPGALVDPLMMDELGISVGDTFLLGGTPFAVRGELDGLPDAAVRGFRLGSTTLITIEGLALLSDRTSPLPGLGTFFRYKLALEDMDAEAGKVAVAEALADPAWTVRSARDGLGPMVRYYDLFMSYLVIVGLASLLIGGVSVWTGIQAYIGERAGVIAVLRSIGAGRNRVFIHFFSQVAMLALVGVGLGLLVGGGTAWGVLPAVGQAVGINLSATLHIQPLAVAAGVGLLIAFAFSYLPLQQAQAISPVLLFRSKGLAAPPIDWRRMLGSHRVLPLLVAGLGIAWLAVLMTGDTLLVLAFALAAAGAVVILQVAVNLAKRGLRRLPEPSFALLRRALSAIASSGSNAGAVVVSVGMALAMLVVVLVLEANLRQEFLGASVFDAPTLVASDLFSDEVAALETMADAEGDIALFTATPMLRAAFSGINDRPASAIAASGPEAAFLMSGEVPITYRTALPTTSRLVEGVWWPADHAGAPLVSLHQSLRDGLGVRLGDTIRFEIFGETISAEIANFRDYSWQGGIDFLATFSPGLLEAYPATLFGAVTAVPGREQALERDLAQALPDVRFIAIGATLQQITSALSQLSFAAVLVGGLAVANGLLVLIGSLATGRRQREADAVITKVLGARRFEVVGAVVIQFLILAAFAAIIATPLGIGLAYVITSVLLAVRFTVEPHVLMLVNVGAVALTAVLGAMTIWRVLGTRPALILRRLATD
ncbi:putative ABC transport system permease protein [Devosia enhydra]|uniref:Putative ABC transport system permease protein n=1 Tax=Devosia enhydra TaxID=665118 RepID=A0A1K2I2J9_9HYPH|nr:FtsX-like permease family protein [Devosia enhydra]SFZ86560.1 putative ABC transport system permease protein [Devosia enhydra]